MQVPVEPGEALGAFVEVGVLGCFAEELKEFGEVGRLGGERLAPPTEGVPGGEPEEGGEEGGKEEADPAAEKTGAEAVE